MKNKDCMQIGIVGLGHLGNYHVKQLTKIDDITIAGLYDIDIQRAKVISKVPSGVKRGSSTIKSTKATTATTKPNTTTKTAAAITTTTTKKDKPFRGTSVKKIGLESKKCLEKGDFNKFAELMNIHWEHKQNRSKQMTKPEINKIYNLALKNGALGGKLVGAGGGGFLMFYSNDKEKLRSIMKKKNLEEVRFNFDFNGTRTIIT